LNVSRHRRKAEASSRVVAPGVWKKHRSPPGSTATTVALVWAASVVKTEDVSTPACRSRSVTAAPSTSPPTSPAAATFMPSLAIATPVLQTFPPVVSWMDRTSDNPPGSGGRRRSIGSAIRSATISPKIAASIGVVTRAE
jgi:hypothetical protein